MASSIDGCFAIPTDILSRWVCDEVNFDDNVIDVGTYGNTLITNLYGPVPRVWVVEPGLQLVGFNNDRARVFNNKGNNTTNSYLFGDNIGVQYCGDSAVNFSVFGWIYPSGNIGADQKIICAAIPGDITNNLRWMIELVDVGGGVPATRLMAACKRGGSSTNTYLGAPTGNIVTQNEWHHIGLVIDTSAGYCELYQDGYPVSSGSITGVMSSGTAPNYNDVDITLGGHSSLISYFDFAGALNDWIFVPRALGSGEIWNISQGGISGINGFIGGYLYPGPGPSGYIGGYVPSAVAISIYADDELMAGVWRFDELSDDAVRVDSSIGGNDLDIITGSPVQVDGRRDKAIQFKHWDEPYPSVARTSSGCFSDIDIELSDWTMGGWIKPSGGAYESYAYVAGKGNYDQYTLYLDEEMEICTQLHFDGIRYMLNGGRVSGLTPNVWNHIDWVVDKGIGYQALYLTPNDGVCEPVLLDRSPIPSGFGEQERGFGPLIFGASPIGREPFDGQLDEWYLRTVPLSALEIQSICLFGLPNQYVIDASGHIGGYMPGAVPLASPSGYIGGYIYHMLVESSGYLGGYLYQTTVPSSASGYVGGYTLVSSYPSGYVGTYMVAHETTSGYVGGYLFGRHDASGAWLAYFDILSTQFLDFDAQTRIGSAENADFDATCTIERVISPPTVACAIDGSSSVSGYAVTFSGVATVADITLLDGRSNQIESAFIKWGDFGTQMVNVNSIGQWQTTHIYPTSGVYMPRIDVVDSNGAHGSCHKKVDLSVGASDIIQLDLTAAPSSGAPPLAVAFTNTYVAQPAGEIESVIDFGDRTLTHLDNPVHLYRYAGHYIAIWIVKDDRGRFWNDSTDVGVNT